MNRTLGKQRNLSDYRYRNVFQFPGKYVTLANDRSQQSQRFEDCKDDIWSIAAVLRGLTLIVLSPWRSCAPQRISRCPRISMYPHLQNNQQHPRKGLQRRRHSVELSLTVAPQARF